MAWIHLLSNRMDCIHRGVWRTHRRGDAWLFSIQAYWCLAHIFVLFHTSTSRMQTGRFLASWQRYIFWIRGVHVSISLAQVAYRLELHWLLLEHWHQLVHYELVWLVPSFSSFLLSIVVSLGDCRIPWSATSIWVFWPFSFWHLHLMVLLLL